MSDGHAPPLVIERALPNAVVYDLTTPGIAKITLPPKSTWFSGLHWHEKHDEFLKVVKGSIRARVGDTTNVITAVGDDHPEVKVHRHVWHEWERAEPDGEDVVVIERTDPADGEKALFFWNLNGVILSAPRLAENWASAVPRIPPTLRSSVLDLYITIQLFVIFLHLDNFPVFANFPQRLAFMNNKLRVLDWAVTHVVLHLSSWLGWFVGAGPVRKNYTPRDEYNAWMAKELDGKKLR